MSGDATGQPTDRLSEAGTKPDEVLAHLRRQDKLLKRLLLRVEQQERTMSELLQQLTDVRRELGPKGVRGAIARVDRSIAALLRRAYLDPNELSSPHDLMAERFGIASQNDEDGMTLAIFRRVGVKHHSFVEIGCGGNGGSSGFLAQECGWSGLMFDDDEFQLMAARYWFESPTVKIVKSWVSRENVNALLREHGATGEIDLLGIDIDGNDYWVWEALEACSPRLVIVEFNAEFGRERSVVVPYDPNFDRHRRHRQYYGASLTALARLADRKGYRLVATEPTGINAYFLRNDVGPDIPACAPERAYRRRYQYFAVPPAGKEHVFAVIARNEWPLTEIT